MPGGMDDSPEMRLRRTFAQRLQIARRNAGLTQEELANKIGRSVDLVSRIERATSGPSLQTIALLAEALDVSPASLLGHHEPRAKRDASDLDDIVQMILSVPASATPRLRKMIRAFLS